MKPVTITEFNSHLDKVMANFPQIALEILMDEKLKISTGLVSDIAKRVQGKSILGDGSTRDYSKKTTLVGPGSFQTKAAFDGLVKKAKKSEDTHWVTVTVSGRKVRLIVLPGGYDAIRKLDGHMNSKKNYSRTKEMWQNFGIKSASEKGVIIGGKSKSSQDKINWNSGRDDIAIIMPTPEEEARCARLFTKALLKKLFP